MSASETQFSLTRAATIKRRAPKIKFLSLLNTKLEMKTKLAALALAFTTLTPALHAQLTVPYANGSDGALVITTDTAIDLSQAVTGVWTNTSGSPGKGIYDPTQ